jgi:hypothetical protein
VGDTAVEVIRLEYTQNEYWDGDVYLPAMHVSMRHDNAKADEFQHVIDTFKQFLVATGWQQEVVDKLVIEETE